MQQQKVILHSEQISRKGEIKYFQIPLQGAAIKIIAVETSAFLFTSVPISHSTQALDPNPPTPATNNCPNPGTASVEPIGDTTDSTTHQQNFKIGDAVNPGFVYSCGIYSVLLSITAVDGDTPATIAGKLGTAVNNTTVAEWNQFGENTNNYKPVALIGGAVLTLITDRQHSFAVAATGSCQATTQAPQVVQYDPLFTITQNERAGVLSLQSPDVTDIFLQCEAWRNDNNINYGDYSFHSELCGEWLKGRKRIATDVSLTTASPILEAYYKDSWGVYHGKDVSYGINIVLWYEKIAA